MVISRLTKKAEPPANRDFREPAACRETESANAGWLRRLVRQQNIHDSIKPVNRKPTDSNLLAARNRRELLFKTNQPSAANSNQNSPANHQKTPPRNPTGKTPATLCCLTKKAEPRRTKNREPRSGTASANRRWLRRLVRRLVHV